jgi:hypothetical protein
LERFERRYDKEMEQKQEITASDLYEIAARGFIALTKGSPTPSMKAAILMDFGDARYMQYEATKDPRARRLAANCYIASRKLNKR